MREATKPRDSRPWAFGGFNELEPTAMTLTRRIWWTVAVLSVALIAQTGVLWHLKSGPANTFDELKQGFALVPLQITTTDDAGRKSVWNGRTSPNEPQVRRALQFAAKDLILRRYRLADSDVELELYLVHSVEGEDRKHHPEICIRDVAGIPEDADGRKTIEIEKGRPAERIVFRPNSNQSVTLYYWHYTFVPNNQPNQDGLQRLYQTFSRNPPSITVQVATSCAADRLPLVEKQFLSALDRMLRDHFLPKDTRIGCDRLPIGLTR